MNFKKLFVFILSLAIILTACSNQNTDSQDNPVDSDQTGMENIDEADDSNEEQPAENAEEKSFTYGMTTEPDHLDPFQATSADSRVMLFNLFEGLLKPAADGTIIPAVAESYTPSKDFKSYTFTLRDIIFHNGNKVTIEDVKYSIEQAMEYKLTGMDAISSIEVVDNKTIVVHLIEPDSEFYYSMTTAVVPNNYTEQNTKPIGTGPFKFVSYTPQQQLVLEKHIEYWNSELPKVDNLTFKFKSDVNTISLDLQAGSLDAGALDAKAADQLNPDEFDIQYANTNGVQMFCLNNAVAPFDNILVRQAISYVVSAEEISELAHNGHAVRAASPVIPALVNGYYSELDSTYAKNVEKAKQLMEEAGYPDGFSTTIAVPSVYQQHVDTAQVIVNQLAEINITAEIIQVDWPTWLSDVYTDRKYETTVVSVDGVTLSPRSYLFRYETDSSKNFINYSNPDYDDLFAKSLTISDEKEKTEIYNELQKILSDEAASVFLCDIASPRVFRKGIHGFVPYPLYIFDASTIYID